MKPILFNTENVRAILEGRKTQTRRVTKPGTDIALEYGQPAGGQPYYKGDILWVRETFGYDSFAAWNKKVYYKADYPDGKCECVVRPGCKSGWYPSIHMPREAARLFLRVTDVRVERLQEIDEQGALDEGAFPSLTEKYGLRTAREDFALIWDETIKKADIDRYSWEANPFCWVITFERINKDEAMQ